MERLETRIEGPVLVRPVVHGDHRGLFHESYRREVYGERNAQRTV
jgi:dTDP-4-dehydrorhamnose 3,5-epimerase-like enzyme